MRAALQLSTLRSVEEPLPELLERVADAGYEGVEFDGLDETRLKPAAAALGRTGLVPVGAQVPYDRLQAARRAVVRELRTVGCERVVVGPLHEDHFADADAVARMATRLSALGGRLAADGRTLLYHNGGGEFRGLDGEDAYDRFVGHAGEGLGFEFDAARAAAAGRDPAALLERLAGRVPLVRLADVDDDGTPVEPGEGVLDLAACADAAREAGAEWLVYERDAPEDPLAAARRGAEVLADLVD